MGKTLIRCLRLSLGIKLDEDGADEFALSCTVSRLFGINHGNQALEFGSAPVDSVDLFANQEFEAVGRSLFRLDPTSGYGARFPINPVVGEFRPLLMVATLLGILETSLVRHGDQLGFCSFELHGRLVALVDQVFDLFAVVSDPEVLDLLPKDTAQLSLIQEIFRHRGEKNRPGGHAICV